MNNLWIKWILFPDDLSDAYDIRKKVFIQEQHCPEELEFDVIDKIAEHAVLMDENKSPIGTARIFENVKGQATIGRVAILKNHRKKGYGELIVKECMERLQNQGYPSILIHAQTYAVPFYEKLGFTAFGEEFMEDGLPHIAMMWKNNNT